MRSIGAAVHEGNRFAPTADDQEAVHGSPEDSFWRYVTFSINEVTSTVYYEAFRGDDALGSIGTRALFLKTGKAGKVVQVASDQSTASIESHYLLVSQGSFVPPKLYDLITGEEPLRGIRFATWIDLKN